ncbi:MAG: thiamine pyrophosphate-binding protein [Chloroflexi bacterium]|nr:thiamine pyrophosphate-binding protein [Chloroflexota bacterium]
MTVAETIAKELYDAGVRHVFGQPGGEVLELIEAFATVGIEFVLMGHEGAAALAAGAMGQATGIPGVCLATLGPGACNLTLGVGDAYLDRHPMLAISARTAVSHRSWFNHQNLRLNEMFAPICKASVALDGMETAVAIQEAITLATQSPQGPVYLSLPGDVAPQPDKSGETDGSISNPVPDPSQALIQIERALNVAKRPFVVVGIALDQRRDMAAIRQFLQTTGLPYADTPKTKGLVDPDGDGYLGTYLSASADGIINNLIKQSDCILGIGFDPVETTYDWHLGDNYYAVVDGSTGFGAFQPPVQAIGDVGVMVRQLSDHFDGAPNWKPETFAAVREQVWAAIRPEVASSKAGLAPFVAAEALRTALPPSTCIAVDTGQHKMVFGQAWRTDEPLTYFNSNGLSSMSTAVPTAIALTVLEPENPAVSVAGDGGFGMMVQELETVQRLGIAPLFVVLCDQALSLIRLPQQMRGLPRRAIDLAPVDWAGVAEAFGLQGVWAGTAVEVRQAVAAWVESPSATVLAVQIDENLYRGNQY